MEEVLALVARCAEASEVVALQHQACRRRSLAVWKTQIWEDVLLAVFRSPSEVELHRYSSPDEVSEGPFRGCEARPRRPLASALGYRGGRCPSRRASLSLSAVAPVSGPVRCSH